MTRPFRIDPERRAKAFETVGLATVRAEEVVAAHRGDAAVRGVAIVIVDFVDPNPLHDFPSSGLLLRRCTTSGAWDLVRGWGGPENDVELGEAMVRPSRHSLGGGFGDALRIRGISMIDRT